MKPEPDEIRQPRPRAPERRLAYEIAIGIIIGGVTLWVLEAIAGMIAMQFALNQIKINLGG